MAHTHNENMRVISTDEELKIFSDPYRMKIIRVFQQSDEPLTVKGCADIMGEVPANVHYHVKKLLSVNILELDHIEVINGINAKYYKLPKQSFTISIKKDDETAMLKQLTQVHSLVGRIIDDFKDEFMKSAAKAVEEKKEKDSEAGMLASNHLYLTEEEFEEVNKFFTTLAEKYKKTNDERKEYVYIGGLARKYENK